MEKQDLTMEGLIHDLNNVFQTIDENAELLQADAHWKKVAGTLQRCVEHGKRLVRSIVESNRSVIEPPALVESAIQFARDYLECVHGPELSFTPQLAVDFQLPGDPAAWERVMVNLFLNSAEAGARKVEIFGQSHQLVISDDGPGIPEELLPHIFQPHVSTKSIFSGLGLYVVQSIVEQHGGAVTAENKPEGGARFRIVFAPHPPLESVLA